MLPAATALAMKSPGDWVTCPSGSDIAATTDTGQIRHNRMKSTRDIRLEFPNWPTLVLRQGGTNACSMKQRRNPALASSTLVRQFHFRVILIVTGRASVALKFSVIANRKSPTNNSY